jgi:hypothetical protein
MRIATHKIPEQMRSAIQGASLLFFFWVLCFSDASAMTGLAGAGLFTITFCLHPHSFRSGRGSLRLALCLVVFVWLCAAVPILLPLLGRH